jgi:AraC-like DNA-binding protein
MDKRKAEHAIKATLFTEYNHYSRDAERKLMNDILIGDALNHIVYGENSRFPLADAPIRSIKNHLISAVAVICRAAADLGADDQFCYALSDYYINEIESAKEVANWEGIINEIFRHYKELVQHGQLKSYSLPVRRAIIYIRQHIYDKFGLKHVAASVNVHPTYLSSQFKKETGKNITDYIIDEKMHEAIALLQNENLSITQISELLGFGSTSYFAKVFRKTYRCTPTEFLRNI